jgi:hypothetical protein
MFDFISNPPYPKKVKRLVTIHGFGGSEVQLNKVTLPEAGKPESRFQSRF